jgi:hypothetical protein
MTDQWPDGFKSDWGAWFEAMEALEATQAVPSPGGWSEPGEPPQGLTVRLDRMPWWVRVGYHIPLLNRSASAWMWSHGGFDVLPPLVKFPPPPEPPPASAASVVLEVTGERVYLEDIRREDPEPGLVHGSGHRWPVGGQPRITNHGRRTSNQRWVSNVYGVRPTSAPVSVRFCRPSRWRFRRRSQEGEVVYGPQGLWAAETPGYWEVVQVSHAGQTHRTESSPWPGLWRRRYPKPRAGEDGAIFRPT